MAALNPQTIARLYTLSEINVKITLYQDALDGSVVKSYNKDSSQGSIRVESADVDKIESILQAWLKAKEILSGLGGTQIVSGNFTDRRRAGIL